MSSKNKSKGGKPTRLPANVSTYLAQLEADKRARLEALFQSVLSEAQSIDIINLWEQPELAVTYWILLITGVNQEEEMAIATMLLCWAAFFSKDSARVLCIQSSERNQFRCCSLRFGVANCPTLVFSDSPDMRSFIKTEPQLLFTLSGKKGGLQRFLTRIHSLIENGNNLHEIERLLGTERFWSGLKLVYNELKGMVSFSIK